MPRCERIARSARLVEVAPRSLSTPAAEIKPWKGLPIVIVALQDTRDGPNARGSYPVASTTLDPQTWLGKDEPTEDHEIGTASLGLNARFLDDLGPALYLALEARVVGGGAPGVGGKQHGAEVFE